ncbi:MAG: tRNA (adenosine(37)-N6)-dimethylallyltransferase MiaA [Dehalococcoidales bacterium]|nr:tRNA (adenosine(37)-N6)-dimethylallyltransferase MiaA [Dehalococcoidales bacterium]
MMNHLTAIVGPTGVGKSRLALHLAQTFNGEIVSADSRQVYRYMNIGTAKPSPEELALAPHHLVNILDPDEDFSLAQYQVTAYQVIRDIQQRQKLPLLVGGSGLYIWAVLEGWQIPSVPPDLELRKSMEEKAVGGGAGELYRELMKVDPSAAQKIDQRNVRRMIRALEISRKTKVPFSQYRSKGAPDFKIFSIGLTVDRTELYRRIDMRVEEMIERGLVAEVEKLWNMGYHFNLPAMSGIGYRQIGMFLRGEVTLETAIAQIKFKTHRFVRNQYAWFRLKDRRIRWFEMLGTSDAEIEEALIQFWEN